MITTGQYPTTVDYTNQIQATDTVVSLGIADSDLTDAYWIGWVKWENLPSNLHVSRHAVNNGVMSLTDVTRPDNVDIALLSGTSNSSTPSQYYTACAAYTSTWGNFTGHNSNGTFVQNRFINTVDVNTTLYPSVFIAFLFGKNDTTNSFLYVNVPIADIVDGDISITISYDGIDFAITGDDIDGTMKTVEINGNTYKYACIDYGVTGGERPINGGGYYAPFTSYLIHDTDDHSFLLGGGRPYPLYWGPISGCGYRLNGNSGGLYYANTVDTYAVIDGSYYLWGGFSGDMQVSDLQSIPVYGMMYTEGCNFFVSCHGRRDICILRRCMVWDDIYKWAAMQMRYGVTNDYTNGSDKYYAKISSDNEFLCEFANGVDDFADLRPWQIVGVKLDATSNAYTPDQKPPYTPGEDDDEKIGDSIGFNINVPGGTASGLYTMYALRQAHVNNIGAALWTSFNSPDSNFWQNVRMAAGLYEEAGSFDLSTILDFIASIRIYPFALINLPGYVGAGTGAIKMGTGKIPLDLSTGGAGNVGIMGSYTGIIDAGSVTIPAHYGDFRDLEGVTMSVYLPYIGNVTLNPAEVTGQTLQATYAVDLTSGSCVAYLLLSGSWGYYPIGVYSGTIGADIPLTASQGNRMFLRDLKNVLGLGSILGGSLSGVDATDGDALAGAIGSGLASGAAYMAKNVYRQGMGSALTPPTLGGGGANFAGFGAPQTAYVQIRRHLYAYTARTFPADQMGRRTYGVKVLGTLSGFTVCDAVDVSGIPAPADIQTDIKKALESGVYL